MRHMACPSCGSSNANALYSNETTYCWVCKKWARTDEGKKKYMGESSSASFVSPQEGGSEEPVLTFTGEVKDLAARGIRKDTCQFWSYRVGEAYSKATKSVRPAHLAYYIDPDTRKPVSAKVRFADKEMTTLGKHKLAPLYGQWLWRDSGKMIVLTEGEIDAMSVSQCQSNKWPVCSVQNGAQGAAASIRRAFDWLMKFETIVFMFDMDEHGRAAAIECAKLFPPGKAKIAVLPLKDANEMLVAGRGPEIIDAIWGAREYRPDGVISINEVKEQALKPIKWGLPWFLPTLTQATYGRRETEIYCLGAGTGIGKTDFITQQIAFDVTELHMKVGAIFLEQPPTETAKRLAGKIAGKRFHVPDDGWTQVELSDALDKLDDKVFLYDHFGETEWEVVRERIRYMAVSMGIKLIYIDHLTALADSSNERESLETLMKELAGIAQELGLIIHLISHLSTPEGKSHEEGGRVTIKNFKGSRAIGFWCYFMFGIERDQQDAKQADNKSSIFRILKDRYTGQATGLTIRLHYDPKTGLLSEEPFTQESEFDAPF